MDAWFSGRADAEGEFNRRVEAAFDEEGLDDDAIIRDSFEEDNDDQQVDKDGHSEDPVSGSFKDFIARFAYNAGESTIKTLDLGRLEYLSTPKDVITYILKWILRTMIYADTDGTSYEQCADWLVEKGIECVAHNIINSLSNGLLEMYSITTQWTPSNLLKISNLPITNDPGVYMDIITDSANPDFVRLYVGSAVTDRSPKAQGLRRRIMEHSSPGIRASKPSLHYHIAAPSTRKMNFRILSNLSQVSKKDRQFYAPLTEFLCCLLFQTLIRMPSMFLQFQVTSSSLANKGLNIASPLHQRFDKMIDFSSFLRLRNSPDPEVRAYWLGVRHIARTNMAVNQHNRSRQIAHAAGSRVLCTFGNKGRLSVTLAGMPFYLLAGDVRDLGLHKGDKVNVEIEVLDCKHPRQYVPLSRPEDPSYGLGMKWTGLDSRGTSFERWTTSQGVKEVLRANTLVDWYRDVSPEVTAGTPRRFLPENLIAGRPKATHT
ncbi:MAG: hypothetical protein M1833_001166 [Piccolia ochrophora]|nr:MAG: hypothetical protein M1833_001166 [Piccolia ochrophora]